MRLGIDLAVGTCAGFVVAPLVRCVCVFRTILVKIDPCEGTKPNRLVTPNFMEHASTADALLSASRVPSVCAHVYTRVHALVGALSGRLRVCVMLYVRIACRGAVYAPTVSCPRPIRVTRESSLT